MRNICKRHILAAALTAVTTAMTAQELNSAYFTQDFVYRHDMNPAIGNDQSYFAVPILGNFNFKLQGNVGVGDFLYKNPNPGGKSTVTFLHPDISYHEAMSGFKDDIRTVGNLRLTIISTGFKGFGGYNTIEINDRTMFGLSMPKSFMEFAKGLSNKDYQFDALGAKAYNYAEIALGHSRDVNERLRVGAKLKVLLGIGRANLELNDMHASLEGDTWVLEGQANAEVNMKGFAFERETKEYKSKPGTYQKVKDADMDDFSPIGGFGLGADLGAVYKVNKDLTVSAAVTDLGFISWSETATASTPGGKFTFDGFHDLAVKNDNAPAGTTFDEQKDSYADQLSDFFNLEAQEGQSGKSTAIAATASLGVEYKLPMYDKLSFGLLGQHHFNGKNFSWSEARLSANWTPLKWLDGGVNIAVNSFSTGMGWVVNIHPRHINFFVGMDHLIAKTNADMIPMSSNANIVFGLSKTWGGSKKKKAKAEE